MVEYIVYGFSRSHIRPHSVYHMGNDIIDVLTTENMEQY